MVSAASPTIHADELENTMAGLIARIGNVPLDRIRTKPATEVDDLAAEAEPGRRHYELIDGILVEKRMSVEASFLAVWLGTVLYQFTLDKNLGIVTGSDGMMRLWPGRVRIPDVAYLSWGRLPGRRIPRQPIPDVAPDLAVEVLEPFEHGRRDAAQAPGLFPRGDAFGLDRRS
jgi:Uma2 family endonuclease